ncbi:MAG: nucleoside monophosphate kinase [Bryobacterales bacterium]|nr:nucleoside monophosphate kinase [Bryobacterales bacterium]
MPKITVGTVAVMLFGPPGSGKGTVAQYLTGCFDVPHISTGHILREQIALADGLGREVKELMDSGKLVADELVNRIVVDRLSRPDCAAGAILDGYPRTVEQAKFISEVLKQRALDSMVIYLDVDYDVVVSRLTARRSCPQCGAVYNLRSKPPKVDSRCDLDGTPLITRDDDREDVIRQRLDNYETQTQPLVDYFREQATWYYRVNGNDGSSEQIAERACALIRNSNP